jgi:4-amino-4-deoxychorismate lyase
MTLDAEPSMSIISTLRYDPILLQSEENSRPALNFISPSPFYMLVYHRDRLLEAAQHFEFDAVIPHVQDGKAFHQELLDRIEEYKKNSGQDEALKLRILFEKSGKMSVEMTPVPSVTLDMLFPPSFDAPSKAAEPHPASQKPFKPSPLTGGALNLGPTDSLPAHPDPPSSTPITNSTPQWQLRLDTQPTPSSPVTLFKTTVRDIYNDSRARALPTHTEPSHSRFVEVILYNECSELTEGSITSLYVYRGGRWVTSPVGVPAASMTATTLKENGDEDGERWDEGELRKPFSGRWGHSVRSSKVGAGGQRGTTRRWALAKGMCMEEPVGVDTVRVGEGVWVSNGVVGFGYGIVVE